MATLDYVTAMRRLAAGVTIVTAAWRGTRAGLTVTSVCSLTAEPPQLLACVHREADAHALILAARAFAVSVLRPSHEALSDHFGGRDESHASNRFVIGHWVEGVTGAPLLADAGAQFECRLVEAVSMSTHSILIGEVVFAREDPHAEALVYHDRAYHRLGSSSG